MKAPKYLPNATEVATRKNRVETHLVKMPQGFISYSTQIFKQNPLFFKIQMLIKERYYIISFFYNSYLATIFLSLIKTQVSTLVRIVKLRQNQSVNKLLP